MTKHLRITLVLGLLSAFAMPSYAQMPDYARNVSGRIVLSNGTVIAENLQANSPTSTLSMVGNIDYSNAYVTGLSGTSSNLSDYNNDVPFIDEANLVAHDYMQERAPTIQTNFDANYLRVTNLVPTPIHASEATSKQYVDYEITTAVDDADYVERGNPSIDAGFDARNNAITNATTLQAMALEVGGGTATYVVFGHDAITISDNPTVLFRDFDPTGVPVSESMWMYKSKVMYLDGMSLANVGNLSASNTSITGTLDVAGNTSMTGTLDVVGDTTVAGTLDMLSSQVLNVATPINGTDAVNLDRLLLAVTTIVNNANGNYAVLASSNSYAAGTLQAFDKMSAGDTTITGAFDVVGNTTIDGNTSITGTVDVVGNTTIDGNTSITGTVDVVGATTVTGDTSITGTVDVVGDTTVTGATTIAGTLGVTGDTSITGTVDVVGDTTVTGDTSITGTVDVVGATTIDGATDITGDTTIDGTLGVTGAVTLEDTVSVYGRLDALTVNATNLFAGAAAYTNELGVNSYMGDIVTDKSLTSKAYVDTVVSDATNAAANTYVELVGDTMSGPLSVATNGGSVTLKVLEDQGRSYGAVLFDVGGAPFSSSIAIQAGDGRLRLSAGAVIDGTLTTFDKLTVEESGNSSELSGERLSTMNVAVGSSLLADNLAGYNVAGGNAATDFYMPATPDTGTFTSYGFVTNELRAAKDAANTDYAILASNNTYTAGTTQTFDAVVSSNIVASGSIKATTGVRSEGTLRADGATTLRSTLVVSGITSIESNLTAHNFIVATNAGYAFGQNLDTAFRMPADINVGTFTSYGFVTNALRETKDAANTSYAILASNNIYTAGTAQMFDAVFASDTSITGNLDVTGATVLADTLDVAGDTSIAGNTSMTGTLDVVGNTTLTGNLDVTGAVELSTDLAVHGRVDALTVNVTNLLAGYAAYTNELGVNSYMGDIVTDKSLTSKAYVDTVVSDATNAAANTYVELVGDTMSGPLSVATNDGGVTLKVLEDQGRSYGAVLFDVGNTAYSGSIAIQAGDGRLRLSPSAVIDGTLTTQGDLIVADSITTKSNVFVTNTLYVGRQVEITAGVSDEVVGRINAVDIDVTGEVVAGYSRLSTDTLYVRNASSHGLSVAITGASTPVTTIAVVDQSDNPLPESVITFGSRVSMDSKKLTGLPEPVDAADAVNLLTLTNRLASARDISNGDYAILSSNNVYDTGTVQTFDTTHAYNMFGHHLTLTNDGHTATAIELPHATYGDGYLQLKDLYNDTYTFSMSATKDNGGHAELNLKDAFGDRPSGLPFMIRVATTMDGNRLSGLPTPTADADAANKQYVDTADLATGVLVTNLITATNDFLRLDGGTMDGNIDMNGKDVLNAYRVEANQARADTVTSKMFVYNSTDASTYYMGAAANPGSSGNFLTSKAYVDAKAGAHDNFVKLSGSSGDANGIIGAIGYKSAAQASADMSNIDDAYHTAATNRYLATKGYVNKKIDDVTTGTYLPLNGTEDMTGKLKVASIFGALSFEHPVDGSVSIVSIVNNKPNLLINDVTLAEDSTLTLGAGSAVDIGGAIAYAGTSVADEALADLPANALNLATKHYVDNNIIDPLTTTYSLAGENYLEPSEMYEASAGWVFYDGEWQDSGSFNVAGSSSTKYMNLAYGKLLKLSNLDGNPAPSYDLVHPGTSRVYRTFSVTPDVPYVLSAHYKLEPNFRLTNDIPAMFGVNVYYGDGGITANGPQDTPDAVFPFLSDADFTAANFDSVSFSKYVSEVVSFTPNTATIVIEFIASNSYRPPDGTDVPWQAAPVYACAVFFDDVSLYQADTKVETVNVAVAELTKKVAVIEQHELQYGKLRGVQTYTEWLRPDVPDSSFGFMEVAKWPSVLRIDTADSGTYSELYFTTSHLDTEQTRTIPLSISMTGFETNVTFAVMCNQPAGTITAKYWGLLEPNGVLTNMPATGTPWSTASYDFGAGYAAHDSVTLGLDITETAARRTGLITITATGKCDAAYTGDPAFGIWQAGVVHKEFGYVK